MERISETSSNMLPFKAFKEIENIKEGKVIFLKCI
jgi:hypothetical protein